MSQATEQSLSASRKKRQEKSAELAKTRIQGKGITSGSSYVKRSSSTQSAYGKIKYSE